MDATKLRELAENDLLMEVGRRAVEDQLVRLRDDRISILRNNGMVIKERDSTPSNVIRLGTEMAVQTALKAIADFVEKNPNWQTQQLNGPLSVFIISDGPSKERQHG